MFPASCSRNPTDPCLLSYQVCAARHQAEAFEVVKSGKDPVLQGGGVVLTGQATARALVVPLLGTGSLLSAACWSLGVKGKGEKGSLLDWPSRIDEIKVGVGCKGMRPPGEFVKAGGH